MKPNWLHVFPHVPQFWRSDLRLLQMPLQDVWSRGHAHDPLTHDVPPEHTVLQPPQL
jgi:hypothetical protein